MAAADVTKVLDKAGVEYELLSHPHTETAAAEAEALGVDPGEVGKTLVLSTPDGNVRAVLPGSARLDVRKVRDVLGVTGKRVHLLSEEALTSDYKEFELGAVPPLGGKSRDRVLVDTRLAERDSVVIEAGSHDESVRLKTADLIRLTEAQVADICRE
ncbi:MAG: aminoacyl-tRNA deacylase [Gaiellaceae bacterium]